MTNQLCFKCGDAPRMPKNNGTGRHSLCETCQRAYWREKHEHQKSDTRRCKRCNETKSLDDFPQTGTQRKSICVACGGGSKRRSKPAAVPTGEKLVLIDKPRGRAVMCRIETIIDLPEDVSTGSLARELLERGYRVMAAGEVEAVVSAEAGD